MSEIIQGDSGVVMQVTIKDGNGIVDIRGTQIEVVIKSSANRIVKQGTIVDGQNGLCEFVLDESDVQNVGNYVFQATVLFPNNRKFSSDLGKFKVGQKI